MTIAVTPPAVGWDLHCHTVFSDGTQSVEYLIQEAQLFGLHGVAISDHDTSAGWQIAKAVSAKLSYPVMYGTEITAEEGCVSVHMLAYQYDSMNVELSNLFQKTRQERIARSQHMVELLSRDYPISWEQVVQQCKEGANTTIGRPHIADALVQLGVVENRSEAFDTIINSRSKYYVPTPSPTTHEVLQAVKAAGGVCVIAHAGDIRRNKVLLNNSQLEQLADEGLDGLEVWHRGNDQFQRERLLDIAQRKNLLVTGGSDWHGKGKPNKLGENLTDDKTVREIFKRGFMYT